MYGTIDATFAAYSMLCFSVLVSSTSASSRSCKSSSVITTPPMECVLPMNTGTRNHMDLVCSVFNEQQPCGKVFLNGFVFNITCDEEYNFNGFDEPSLYTFYINGTWTPRVPDCKRWCRALKSLRVDVTCQYRGKTIDCNNSVPAGTEAIGRCKKGYLPYDKAANVPIVCGENGEWSNGLLDCATPACGKVNSTDSLFPWLVAIYVKGSRKCLGTLVSSRVVLTGGYCVQSGVFKILASPQSIKVTVGKGNFYESRIAETIHVREVSVHPQFFGDNTNLAVDIALLYLETSVSSIPACVDWSHEFQFTQGQMGTAAWWYSSPKENNVEYTYLDYASCVSEVETSYRRYITHDKFCYKHNNSRRVDVHQHGAGLMVERNDLYYVKGIASKWIGKYGSYTIRVFVNLSDVTIFQWLRQTLISFDTVHN